MRIFPALLIAALTALAPTLGLAQTRGTPTFATLTVQGLLTAQGNVAVTGALSAASLTLTAPLALAQGGCGATSAATCRTALGLGGAATLNIGTATGTVAAGDDSRIVGALQSSTAASTYAPLASPTFTGSPVVPGYLTTSGAASTYAPLASPTFTGTPAVPTATTGTNTTQAASTAFVAAAVAAIPGAATPTYSPVRQTVQSGPAASGAPSFLPPTTTGTLTLTAQNVSGTSPLVSTAAQGFGSSGAVDLVSRQTSNPSWSLTASTTNYLFGNASSGASYVSTLVPIYQFGGTPSTTSGQFTFDYQAMVGYLGNGTTAVATPLVAVGEAVTSSTAVTSTIAYAYQSYYDSGWTATLPAAAAASAPVKAHNLGIQPQVKKLIAENTTAEAGYSVGEQVGTDNGLVGSNPSYDMPPTFPSTRNSFTVITPSSTAWNIPNKTNGQNASLTNANWRWRMIASRGW